MSGIDPSVSKKKKKETVKNKTFIKWSCIHYFNIEVDRNGKVTRFTCKICTLCLPQIWVETRENECYEPLLALLLKYADSLDSSHKGNIDKHGKSGEQHNSSRWKCNNMLVIKSSFHVRTNHNNIRRIFCRA